MGRTGGSKGFRGVFEDATGELIQTSCLISFLLPDTQEVSKLLFPSDIWRILKDRFKDLCKIFVGSFTDFFRGLS